MTSTVPPGTVPVIFAAVPVLCLWLFFLPEPHWGAAERWYAVVTGPPVGGPWPVLGSWVL